MSESSNKFLMSLPTNLREYIDDTVGVINGTKETWQSKVNRQSVIRGIMEYSKRADLQFSSGNSRHVYVSDKIRRD